MSIFQAAKQAKDLFFKALGLRVPTFLGRGLSNWEKILAVGKDSNVGYPG